MNPIIFSGPTLPKARIEELYPDAEVLGPAECGDVYLACSPGRRAIGLIDGYSDDQRSVWHKELLWAISLGIPVYGAASLGALRAAELASYGMVGVGLIFEHYSKGVLEDDDEVSALHEPSAGGFRAKSDAMVNVRATLASARNARVITEEEESAIVAAGRSLFYAEREFFSIVELAKGVRAERKAGLVAWVRRHGIRDQKRADAEAMVVAIRNDLENGCSRTVPVFHFEATNHWRAFRTSTDRSAEARSGAFEGRGGRRGSLDGPRRAPDEPDPALLEALKRRAPELYRELLAAAFGRALALVLADRAQASVGAPELQRQSEAFRRERGLHTPETVDRWLQDNALDREGFTDLARDDALAARFASEAERLALAELPNLLRARGLYPAIASERLPADTDDRRPTPK